MTFKPAFLIPVYNHHTVLERIIKVLEGHGLPCLMVNDGSSNECREEMERLASIYDWVDMVSLPVNEGKGGAVIRGIKELHSRGFTHAFQVDADGQHDLTQISSFLKLAEDSPKALVLGQATYDESVPKSRLYGRYITHVWVWIETLSFSVKDSMCGFRVYPIALTHKVINETDIGKRMEFDVEVIVRMFWAGAPVVSAPVHVQYPLDGISHFDVLNDNLRISKTHAKLFFGMLLRAPKLIWRLLVGRR